MIIFQLKIIIYVFFSISLLIKQLITWKTLCTLLILCHIALQLRLFISCINCMFFFSFFTGRNAILALRSNRSSYWIKSPCGKYRNIKILRTYRSMTTRNCNSILHYNYANSFLVSITWFIIFSLMQKSKNNSYMKTIAYLHCFCQYINIIYFKKEYSFSLFKIK